MNKITYIKLGLLLILSFCVVHPARVIINTVFLRGTSGFCICMPQLRLLRRATPRPPDLHSQYQSKCQKLLGIQGSR